MRKATRRKVRRDTFGPIHMMYARHAFFRELESLQEQAEWTSLIGDDVLSLCDSAGRLLFIALRAMQLSPYEISEEEHVNALSVMGDVLGDVREAECITSDQRQILQSGLDVVSALLAAIEPTYLGAAAYQLEQALQKGLGTHDIQAMLQ